MGNEEAIYGTAITNGDKVINTNFIQVIHVYFIN